MALYNNNIQKIYDGKVAYATGTGRCGTQFITKLISMEHDIASSHERDINNESFHRYCKWYGMPVDEMGFIYAKQMELENDLKTARFSFEASAQLSFSIKTLHDAFSSKFIFLIRNPEKVVNSFRYKNIYHSPYITDDASKALGYQKAEYMHRFLGRFAPKGEFLKEWNSMTQIGRIAWYWNITNQKIMEQLETIPKSSWHLVKIEEFDFNEYLKITNFLGFKTKITPNKFEKLRKKRPNSFKKVGNSKNWTATEIQEFESQVAPMAKLFSYSYKGLK